MARLIAWAPADSWCCWRFVGGGEEEGRSGGEIGREKVTALEAACVGRECRWQPVLSLAAVEEMAAAPLWGR
jgi:hypothetical protein